MSIVHGPDGPIRKGPKRSGSMPNWVVILGALLFVACVGAAARFIFGWGK